MHCFFSLYRAFEILRLIYLNRQNVQQQSIMVTQKKTTTVKRSRHSLTVTPLTRQVMTKSIHRAILQYQHSQHGIAMSPKSPLDLRVRATISRDDKDVPNVKNCLSKMIKTEEKLPIVDDNNIISTSIVIKSNSVDSNSRLSPLETVYEQDKDTNVEALECCEHESYVSNYETVEVSCNINEPVSDSIKETPVLASRKLSSEIMCDSDNVCSEVWYTPKEYVETKVIENIEVCKVFNFHSINGITQKSH